MTFVTLAIYIVWTTSVTEWRLKFRRSMNETDNQATTRAVDSLLNFETVKYFGNEEHETERFDTALRRYEDAAIQSGGSLALLNIGQGMVISIGVVVMMIMAGQGVADGTMTVGDFVLVNTYLIQLSYRSTFWVSYTVRSSTRSPTWKPCSISSTRKPKSKTNPVLPIST